MALPWWRQAIIWVNDGKRTDAHMRHPAPHKGQWREAFMFSLIYDWINGWVNNVEAGDFRRHRAHYDVTVIVICMVCLEAMCVTYDKGLL